MFLGDPDPLVRGTDPAPAPALDPALDPVQIFRIRPGQKVPDPNGSGSTTLLVVTVKHINAMCGTVPVLISVNQEVNLPYLNSIVRYTVT
jgi:hypothetical protein